MKIEEIKESTIHYITTDEEDYYQYIRHSATNWEVTMGESRESVYPCDDLEVMFQKMLKKG